MKWMCVLFMGLFLSGCSGNEGNQTPDIDQELMTDILVDLHIAEAYVQSMAPAWKDSVNQATREAIARIYGMTPEEMEVKILLLQKHPEAQQEIYEQVLSRLDSLKEHRPANKLDTDL